MARHLSSVGTLSVLQGQNDTKDVLSLERGRVALDGAVALAIHAPASLTGNVTVQVHPEGDSVPTWRNLIQNGSPVTVAAGSTVIVYPVAFGDLRLHSDAVGGEVLQRDFVIEAQTDAAF